MKKYLLLSLVCLSFSAVAMEKHSAKLGQVDNSFGQNDCNAPQIAGCGPCYKLCIEQNKSDRGAKDTSGGSKSSSKSTRSSATRQ
jgi:hypothetical protein